MDDQATAKIEEWISDLGQSVGGVKLRIATLRGALDCDGGAAAALSRIEEEIEEAESWLPRLRELSRRETGTPTRA